MPDGKMAMPGRLLRSGTYDDGGLPGLLIAGDDAGAL